MLKKVFFFTLILQFISCSNDFKFQLNTTDVIKHGETLSISVIEKNQHPIDSVLYQINGKKIKTQKSGRLTINTKNYKLGKHSISALIFYNQKTKKLNKSVTILATKKPEIYTYRIINTYPHDPKAFTQGLEFYNGELYETTGQYGQSTLRRVELESGKTLQKINFSEKVFGEGMTIFNDEIHCLTWKSNVGFVFDINTFKEKRTFSYSQSKEGWGLTHNKRYLIKSDGSERLWFLDPNSDKELNYIEAYTNKRKVTNLNELEYIDGKIYANIWQKNSIVIINPENGTIESIINLKGLKELITKNNSIDQVLNGIAYDNTSDRLFVTGKNWDKLFEIKLIKQ